MNTSRLPILALLPVCIASLTSGCGPAQSTVSGNVSYAGKPVQKGFISFFPVDDRGPASGGEIRDGQYRVSGIAPGKRKVLISNSPELATEGTARGNAPPKYVHRDPYISNNATGNQQLVDLSTGEQALDFHLLPAAK